MTKIGLVPNDAGLMIDNGTKIVMKNENGNLLSFPSINATRKHFRVRFSTISLNVDKNNPILI